jgi:hypothetical protein
MIAFILLAVAHPGPTCGTLYSRHIVRDQMHRPRRDDPWVRRYVALGETLRDARIHRADDVVNSCGDDASDASPGPMERRLLDWGFASDDAHELAYAPPAERRRAVETMILCGPNGANDDDGDHVSCDGPQDGHFARSMPEYDACGWEGYGRFTPCARPGWNRHAGRYDSEGPAR